VRRFSRIFIRAFPAIVTKQARMRGGSAEKSELKGQRSQDDREQGASSRRVNTYDQCKERDDDGRRKKNRKFEPHAQHYAYRASQERSDHRHRGASPSTFSRLAQRPVLPHANEVALISFLLHRAIALTMKKGST
jgi:hypothetical protein